MDELKDALKVSLANRGVLDDIKARIRAEVFSAIESDAVRVHASVSSSVRITRQPADIHAHTTVDPGRAEAGPAA